MAVRSPSTVGHSHEDFQLHLDWTREPASVTLRLDLPGLDKEDLRVQIENIGNLKISGERPYKGDKSSRFSKEDRIPDDRHTDDHIRAWFENGALYVTWPEGIDREITLEQATPTEESLKSQKTQQRPDSTTSRHELDAKAPSTATGKETPDARPPSTTTGKETTGIKLTLIATGKETTAAKPSSTATSKRTTGAKPPSAIGKRTSGAKHTSTAIVKRTTLAKPRPTPIKTMYLTLCGLCP